MATIDDVARHANVSTATVSRTLSGRGPVADATRERVLAAADALGYVVSSSASSLASGRTRNIGVLVPHLDQWFFSEVLTGITASLQAADYDTALYVISAHAADPAARRRVFEQSLRRQRIDGLVVVSIALDAREIAQVRALGIPVIAIGGPDSALPSLSVDNVAVARMATAHLLALGHRDIAHIGLSPQFEGDFHIPSRRRKGFEAQMADAEYPVGPGLFEPADYTMEGGARAAHRLLARTDRPTAIFAASDEMAIGAILAARERGLRVPEDLSIVGVDGHELGEFFSLTTVDQFPLRQGQRAAAAILAELGHAPAPATTPLDTHGEMPFELVVRGSTTSPSR